MDERDHEEPLYLLWNSKSWGVYTSTTCPDPHGMPSHWYKRYSVPSEKYELAFQNLLEKSLKLHGKSVVPTKKNCKGIFPRIEDILRNELNP